MTPESPSSTPGEHFERLVALMARLRSPGGCPWDQAQTFASIKKYTLEETYEVLDAIDQGNWDELRDELGDYLLQAVFYARIAEEAGYFTIGDSLRAINEKLIRRHPHVFGDGEARTPEEVKQRWDEIKKREKPGRKGLLGGVSRSQPALAEAQQLTAKAATVGFDWPDTAPVLDKLAEELTELKAAPDAASQEDELGDILFVAVNLARKYGVDAEQALRRSNQKFRERFRHIEASLGGNFDATNLEEMDRLWNEAKTLRSAR